MATRFAYLLSIVYSVVFFGALAAVPIWAWRRWLQEPRVRGILPAMSVGGLGLASASILIGIAGFVRALFNPVLLYFDPVLQRMTGAGLVVSLLALLLSLCGVWRKSPARWHSLALSLVLFMMWLGAAISM